MSLIFYPLWAWIVLFVVLLTVDLMARALKFSLQYRAFAPVQAIARFAKTCFLPIDPTFGIYQLTSFANGQFPRPNAIEDPLALILLSRIDPLRTAIILSI